jgi:hypothetical protein
MQAHKNDKMINVADFILWALQATRKFDNGQPLQNAFM